MSELMFWQIYGQIKILKFQKLERRYNAWIFSTVCRTWLSRYRCLISLIYNHAISWFVLFTLARSNWIKTKKNTDSIYRSLITWKIGNSRLGRTSCKRPRAASGTVPALWGPFIHIGSQPKIAIRPLDGNLSCINTRLGPPPPPSP